MADYAQDNQVAIEVRDSVSALNRLLERAREAGLEVAPFIFDDDPQRARIMVVVSRRLPA